MAAIDEVRDFIVAGGIVNVTDDNTGTGEPPATPALYTVVRPDPTGLPPERKLGTVELRLEYPTVEIECRGEPEDFEEPFERARSVMRLLTTVAVTTLSGVVYHFITPLQSEPYLLQYDDDRRARVVFQASCEKEPSAVT